MQSEPIPLAARIFAVADVFDALTSMCIYKAPWPLHEVMRHSELGSGKAFDPRIVAVFGGIARQLDGEVCAAGERGVERIVHRLIDSACPAGADKGDRFIVAPTGRHAV